MNRVLLLSGPNKNVGFEKEIKELIKEKLSGEKNIVFISASPDNYEKNDKQVYGKDSSLGIIKMLKQCNVKINNCYILDNRNINNVDKDLLKNANIIYFMGGDPIEQNEFVIKNNLLELIKESKAFLIGVSAGSMNLATKAFIPQYENNPTPKFIDGFKMCDVSIIPHFNINDYNQVNEAKENGRINKLIGLPNDSAIFIENDSIKYINEYYLYE